MKKLLLFALLVCIKQINAQSTFQITYGSGGTSIGSSILSDNSGFTIAGTTSSLGQGKKDVLLMKTNLNGSILWSKTIGGKGDDMANAIKKTSDGGYIMVGSTTSYVQNPADSSNFYIIKTDNAGNIKWTRSVGGSNIDVAKDVIETYDHKYAIVGYTKSIGPGNEDIYLVELDSIGTLQWAYGMGSTASEFGNSLLQTPNHNFVIVGSTTGFGTGGQTPYLITTSEFGVVQSPSYVFNLNTGAFTIKKYFTKIINGYGGDYAITGSDGLGSMGDAQHFILDLKQDMTINWARKYYLNSGEGVSMSIEKTNSGGYILAGTMGIDAPALVKTDSIGHLIDTKIYDTPNYFGKGFDVKPTSDGAFAFVGYRYSPTDTSIYLVKTDTGLLSGCNEDNPSLGTENDMSPTYSLQTTVSDTGSNYITIDSGIVATVYPTKNILCGAVLNCTPTVNFNLIKDTAQLSTWEVYPAYSSNVTNAIWYWGDSTSTQGLYPTHTYSAAGKYNIHVTAFASCGDSAVYSQNDSIYRLSYNSVNSSMIYVSVLQNTSSIKTTNTQNSTIQIYPNPAQNNFTIETNTNQKQTLQVFDVNGKQVLLQTINGTTTIDISNLNAGVYSVNSTSNFGTVNKKLVIVK